MMIAALVLILTLQAAPEVRTLEDGQASAPAQIEDVAFLAGRWSGEGLGGFSEESYLPPSGGQMPGVFRHMKDGEPIFYEFMLIEERGNSLVFHVKHFNPDMTGWEAADESVVFPLVAVEGQTAYFDGLTLSREGGALTAAVRIDQEDGPPETAVFHYRLTEPDAPVK